MGKKSQFCFVLFLHVVSRKLGSGCVVVVVFFFHFSCRMHCPKK